MKKMMIYLRNMCLYQIKSAKSINAFLKLLIPNNKSVQALEFKKILINFLLKIYKRKKKLQ